MTAVPNITLNNGVEIPQLGFGVFQIEPEKTKDATLAALEVGYRHIDTAEMYGNEKEVGEAVRASGIDRGDIFVTSKLNNGFHAYDDALERLRRDARRPRHRLRRPVPRALAAAGRRRLRRDLEGDGEDVRGRQGQGDRRLELPARPTCAASTARPA